jgi:hypothetical protein
LFQALLAVIWLIFWRRESLTNVVPFRQLLVYTVDAKAMTQMGRTIIYDFEKRRAVFVQTGGSYPTRALQLSSLM